MRGIAAIDLIEEVIRYGELKGFRPLVGDRYRSDGCFIRGGIVREGLHARFVYRGRSTSRFYKIDSYGPRECAKRGRSGGAPSADRGVNRSTHSFGEPTAGNLGASAFGLAT